MKKILLIVIAWLTGCAAFCQGSWDIGYIEIDSVVTSYIGESVKIDFKYSGTEKKRTSTSVRSYLIRQDTAIISLDGEDVKVTEKWTLYVDHGSFDDQYVELIDQRNVLVRRIYDTKLIEIAGDSLKFSVRINSYDKQSKDRDKKINATVKEFWINRKHLDGLIIKI